MQRTEPAVVYSSTGHHHQEREDERCLEETRPCGRSGPGGEWETGATGDTGGVELAVYLTRAEHYPREDGSVPHRPPDGRAGHRAGGEETDSGDSFVYLGGAVCGDGKVEREVSRRAQAGANAWIAVEGVSKRL